jgi:hypothetical protein
VLDSNDGIEAKTLFEVLQREHPGKYQDGQLRTFQRRVKLWRALKGPGNEVFFPQVYIPGEWCESDFTQMKPLGVIFMPFVAVPIMRENSRNYYLHATAYSSFSPLPYSEKTQAIA